MISVMGTVLDIVGCLAVSNLCPLCANHTFPYLWYPKMFPSTPSRRNHLWLSTTSIDRGLVGPRIQHLYYSMQFEHFKRWPFNGFRIKCVWCACRLALFNQPACLSSQGTSFSSSSKPEVSFSARVKLEHMELPCFFQYKWSWQFHRFNQNTQTLRAMSWVPSNNPQNSWM
jgi:hypothetical protein